MSPAGFYMPQRGFAAIQQRHTIQKEQADNDNEKETARYKFEYTIQVSSPIQFNTIGGIERFDLWYIVAFKFLENIADHIFSKNKDAYLCFSS